MSSIYLLALVPSALAQPQPEAAEVADDFVPVEELRDYVAVSTKVTQPAIETPASVIVISREEIARRGYGSVAEALRSVPGFYVSYDLVNYHVGVRGALGGARSGARLLKVMIDGVAVPFVQTESYFLGPEFLPVSAIERIEVMRGPVSSLYGAGAYSGAINIVTREAVYAGDPVASAEVRVLGGVGTASTEEGNPSDQLLGVDATLTYRSRDTSVVAGVHVSNEDRSGLTTPAESLFADPDGKRSQQDRARPMSFFARINQRIGTGRLTMLGVGQVSDRSAEFHDLSQLTHDTRQNLRNLRLAASYEYPFGANGTLVARGSFGTGGVGPGDRFRLNGETDRFIERDLGFVEGNGGVEVRFDYGDSFVMFGADGMADRERLPSYTIVLTEEDQRLEPYGGREELLYNGGVFGQALADLGQGFKLTGGARLDVHSVYGPQASGRVAALYNPSERFALKAMGGTSFKAASPEQLYATPLTLGDVNGDEAIRPQRLYGGELAMEVFPTRSLKLAVTGFANRYQDTIGYLNQGGQLVPTAYDADNVGGEASVRLRQSFDQDHWLGGQVSASLQSTRTEEVDTGFFRRKDFPDDEAVPRAMGYARLDAGLDRYFLNFAVEGWYIGERVPSQSNLLEAGAADMAVPPYTLEPHMVIDATVSTPLIPLTDSNAIRLLVKVNNLLDSRHSEIGFNGVDVPVQGRRFLFRLDLTI